MTEFRDVSIVAIRELQIIENGGVATVTLYTPQLDSHGDWECAFDISGISSPIADSAFGIDPMQALIQALEGVRVALEGAPESFSWAGEEGSTGFPRFVPSFFGTDFSARLSDLIDKEVQAFAAEAEDRYKQQAKGRR